MGSDAIPSGAVSQFWDTLAVVGGGLSPTKSRVFAVSHEFCEAGTYWIVILSKVTFRPGASINRTMWWRRSCCSAS